MDLQYPLGMAGIVAFALAAVLTVTPKGIDLFAGASWASSPRTRAARSEILTLGVPVVWAASRSCWGERENKDGSKGDAVRFQYEYMVKFKFN